MENLYRTIFRIHPDEEISLWPLIATAIVAFGILLNIIGRQVFAGQPIGVFIYVFGWGMALHIAMPLMVSAVLLRKKGGTRRRGSILVSLVVVALFFFSAFVGVDQFLIYANRLSHTSPPSARTFSIGPGLREMVPDALLAARGEAQSTVLENWHPITKRTTGGQGQRGMLSALEYIREQHPHNSFQFVDFRLSQDMYHELNDLIAEMNLANARGLVDTAPIRIYYLPNTWLVVGFRLED